jgi:hypothetical protein
MENLSTARESVHPPELLRKVEADGFAVVSSCLSEETVQRLGSGLSDSSYGIAEFQKILDHPGIVGNEPIGALAHLVLARAYALSGDTVKAKSAYQDFFALWKDADPDIPVLIAAKSEYAKLQ